MRLIAGLVAVAAVAVAPAAAAAAPARTVTQEVTYTTWADCTADGVENYDAVYNGGQHQAEQVATRYQRNGCDTYITFWPDWVQ